jgi:hypothetical protein
MRMLLQVLCNAAVVVTRYGRYQAEGDLGAIGANGGQRGLHVESLPHSTIWGTCAGARGRLGRHTFCPARARCSSAPVAAQTGHLMHHRETGQTSPATYTGCAATCHSTGCSRQQKRWCSVGWTKKAPSRKGKAAKELPLWRPAALGASDAAWAGKWSKGESWINCS